MKLTHNHQEGFSILEAVISLFIIGVIFVFVNGAFSAGLLTKNTKYQELALRIAISEIEQLRTTLYSSLPTSGTFSNSMLSSLPSGQGKLTMTDYNAATKQADVTVTWIESTTGNTHAVTLTTLITQIGGLK